MTAAIPNVNSKANPNANVVEQANALLTLVSSQIANCCGPEDIAERSQIGKGQAERLAAMLKALAHPVRLQIVDILSRVGGDVCACDLEAQFDLKQPTISHHLKLLRQAGLIACERRGLWAYYYTVPANLTQLGALISGFAGQEMPSAQSE